MRRPQNKSQISSPHQRHPAAAAAAAAAVAAADATVHIKLIECHRQSQHCYNKTRAPPLTAHSLPGLQLLDNAAAALTAGADVT